jgi:Na+/H+ antiporter NhaD/arsenite permease-like protein
MLAYSAGAVGSTLIIGSAADVTIIGILKINFVWYLKRISWLMIVGYLAGFAVYYFLNH